MKLLLTPSGITNKSIKKALLALLGKPYKKSHLTFIPTAANAESGDKDWLIKDINNFKKLGFKTFDVTDISRVSKDIWLPSFENADILVFGGGNVNYLLSWVKKSGLEKMLPELLKSKVCVGISAGSRALGRDLLLSHSVSKVSSKVNHGLEIVGFSIVPHINSQHFPERTFKNVEKESKKISHPVYALDDNSAVLVKDQKISTISEGKWKRYN